MTLTDTSPAKVKLYTNVFHQPHNTINIKAELCFHRRKTPLFESYITQSWGISSAAAPEDGEAMFLRRRKQLLFNQDHIHRVQLINLYPQARGRIIRPILRPEQSRIVAEQGEIKSSVMKQLLLVNETSYKL